MPNYRDQITDYETALADTGHQPGITKWAARERTGSWFPALMQQRMQDMTSWQIAHFTGLVTAEFSSGGVNTEVITISAVGEGGVLMTTAVVDNDSAFIHSSKATTILGQDAHWDATLEPFMVARVLCGPANDQQNTEVEYSIGLAREDPDTGPSAALGGTAEGARWRVTNGAAGGAVANWTTETTIGDADTVVDSNVLSQRATFVTLGVFLDADRKAHYYSDLDRAAGTLVKQGSTSAALVTGLLSPHMLVQVNNTSGDDAKAMAVAWAYWGQRTVAR